MNGEHLGDQVGVLVFDPMLATAGSLIQVLERLEERGVGATACG